MQGCKECKLIGMCLIYHQLKEFAEEWTEHVVLSQLVLNSVRWCKHYDEE